MYHHVSMHAVDPVAAAVEAKEVTTLAVARAVLSDVGEAGMASS